MRDRMSDPRWFSAWVCTLLFCLCTTAQSAVVTATVDKPVVALGDTITLTIRVEGARIEQPGLPPLPNFTQVGTSTSFQFNNGAVSQAFAYELSPQQPGEFMIPAMQLNTGSEVAVTQPIKVTVVKQAPAAAGPPPALVQINLPKTNLYVGEVVDLEIRVLFQEGRITQYPQLPADSGFTIGKWLKPTETRVALSNAAYTAVIFKAPITAVKAGALSVGPVTQPIVVPDRTRRPNFFFQNEREVRATAEAVTAIALPIPTNNVPETFAGAVGQYSVAVSASPTNVAVGDPITVRVRLNGRGWLDALTLPAQPQWRDFKSYAPTAKIEGSDANNVSGTKTFEVAVVPQNPSIKALPPFTFTFFDPAAGAFRTAAAGPIPLTVTPSAAAPTALPRLTATNSATPPPMADITHIKLRLGTAAGAAPLINQPWFIALQCVAPALWLGMLVRRKRAESLASNPRLRRRREADAFVSKAVGELRTHAQARQSDEFFATLFRALQERIGERLDVPAGSVTEAVVDEQLRPRGLPEDARALLHELFQAANLARYAPVKSSSELSAQIPKAEKALDELRNWEPKR